MSLDRRGFLGGLAASAAVGSVAGAGVRIPDDGARLRVGVLSDVHLTEPVPTCASDWVTTYHGDGFRQRLPSSAESFRTALRYFRERGADAVVVAGDLCDSGFRSQFRMVRRIWDEVFPGDRAPDGRPVERIFVTGNHEEDGWRYNCVKRLVPDEAARREQSFAFDREGVWREAFGEDYAPFFIKRVKGYAFTCAHWCGSAGVSGGLGGFLDAHRRELEGEKPFFHVQHVHPKGTCSSPSAPCDDGSTTAALARFPNAIAFTGHSHATLTDERAIWQGSFTSVGCGSLRFCHSVPGFDNGTDESADAVMDPTDAYQARQGLFMTVYDHEIVLERRDFLRGMPLADGWRVPLGSGEKPYRTDRRVAAEKVGDFPVGAKVEFLRLVTRFRDGKTHDALALRFPQVVPQPGVPRPQGYEIAADGICRRVLSSGALFAEQVDREAVVAVVPADELPAGKPIAFAITPLGAFGARGRSLVARFEPQIA